MKALVKKGFLERVGDARTSRGLRVTHEARGGFRDASTVAVPIIGRVAAGSPILAEENYAGTLHMDASVMPHQAPVFALIVHGNSMIEDGILDGDYVFVRKQAECRNGDIMVAMVDGEATCKRFFRERGRIRLQPANAEMLPIFVDSSRDLQVLGVVIGVYRRIMA